MNITIFASGGGSNFQALLDKQISGDLPVKFVACIGNNSSAKAFERAQQNHIPTFHIAPSHFSDIKEYEEQLLTLLSKVKTDLIVLAGYMKQIPASVINAYENKIINIHPALLPAFGGQGMYGMNVHNAVIEYGAKLSGITVHYVDEKYDHGAIITQKAIPVEDTYTSEDLAKAVLKLEHETLWKVVKALSLNKITIKDRKVYGTI